MKNPRIGIALVELRIFNPLALLVWIFEGVRYSHSAVLVETDLGIQVFESTYPKSRVIEHSKWNKKYRLREVHWFEIKSDRVMISMLRTLASEMGKPYSLMQIIRIAGRLLLSKMRVQVGMTSLNGGTCLICTELCYRLLDRHANMELPDEAGDWMSMAGLRDVIAKVTAEERKGHADFWKP